MTKNDEANSYQVFAAEELDVERPKKTKALTWIPISMGVAFFVCLFCGPYWYLQWVHHFCFLTIFVFCVYYSRKAHALLFLAFAVLALVFWFTLGAITYLPHDYDHNAVKQKAQQELERMREQREVSEE